jgi:hypothetical protein
MTDQEIFDTVAKHLIAQGKQSLLPQVAGDSEYNGCAYRGENGTKCAIGCLIPDELYNPIIENTSVQVFFDTVSATEFVRGHNVSAVDPEIALDDFLAITQKIGDFIGRTGNDTESLLGDLQSAHDNCFGSIEDIKGALYGVAEDFELSAKVLGDD